MKKSIILFLTVIVMLLSSCSTDKAEKGVTQVQTTVPVTVSGQQNDDEIRAVWVNFNELSMKSSSGGTEEEFRQKFNSIIETAKTVKANRVIVQVRPYSDAFYNSAVYPASEYLSGTQGVSVSYDALKIMVEIAHENNICIDAWINPYRVSYKNDFSLLADNNPAKQWYNEDNATDSLIIIEKGIFYNPASQKVQKLIIDGVREIIRNYDVDGIHIDDYFYPSTDSSIDEKSYNDYVGQGGRLDLSSWRRENVNSFVSGLYSVIKLMKPTVLFTISPSGDIEKNYNEHYADVPLWLSRQGYADIIMPQIYYGFLNESQPFEVTLNSWQQLERSYGVKLCIGLAVYKCDKEDTFAGAGATEWQNNTDIISRQIQLIRQSKNTDGFALYSYSYLCDNNLSENAKKALQSTISVI